MPSDIHHGGGAGTYKTFSVLQRQAIPHLKEGRTVISTIRGFDSTRVIEAVLEIELPESANIIYVDIDTSKGLQKIRRFWEWAPNGAYIMIDEAQLVFLKSKRPAHYDYEARDGMTSEQTAEKDDRPNGLIQAFTMQRHWGWDITLITPNIKMLIPEIKEVSRVAYEHKYMGGLLPWAKHGWREIQHSPLETGKQSKMPPVRYKADKRIYQVYRSTKSGNHSSENAELSIFKNPKVVRSLLFAALAIAVCIYTMYNLFFSSAKLETSKETDISNNEISFASVRDNVPVRDVVKDNIPLEITKVETTRFHSKTMAIVGKFFDNYTIEVGEPPNAVQYTTSYLYQNGVKLKIVSDCLIEMTFDSTTYNVRCPLHRRFFDAPKTKHEPINIVPLGGLTGA